MTTLNAAPVTMAKISAKSATTANREYDLFSVPMTETTELDSTWVSSQPLTVSDNTSQFSCELPASSDCATDLANSFVILKFKATKSDGTALPATGHNDLKVFPDQNLAHSMFDSVTLSINNVDTFHTSNYAHNAYHERLLHESESQKKHRMAVEGWLTDESACKDEADVSAADKTSRKAVVGGSREVELTFNPLHGLSKTSRRIPPNTQLKLTLNRAAVTKYLLSEEVDEDVVVKITRLEWMVRRCRVNPAVVRAFTGRLMEGAKYQLPNMRKRTRSYTVARGVTEHRVVIQSNDFLPQAVVVGMVSQAAMSGAFKLSQFNYKPHGANYFELTVDGATVGKPIKCDFANKNAAQAYTHTIASLGQFGGNGESVGLTYEDFMTNKMLLVWSLADIPDEDWGEVFHIKKKGTLELVIRFAAATTETLAVVVTDTKEDLVELDLENRVSTTGTIA